MKPLETLIGAGPVTLADRPGLLPRGAETFDWRVVRARMLDHERREREAAKGFSCPTERARREARADVWNTAAAEVEAEAKRKGLV